ncbi:putative P-loop containing nucleoside triphosphate hydrolase [Helianthus anomalus]
MTDTDLETFMAKLTRLLYNDTLIGANPILIARKPKIQLLYEELGYLIGSSCFNDTSINEHELKDVGNWKRRLIKAAREAEETVDMFLSFAIIKNDAKDCLLDYDPSCERMLTFNDKLIDLFDQDLKDVMDDLKSIREGTMSNYNYLGQSHNVSKDLMMDNKLEATGTTCSSENTTLNIVTGTSGNTTVNLNATEHEELIVGLEDYTLLIIDRLTGDRKKRDIISIVGMGGLGKTTLATKIFNDSLVDYHFDKRGWVTVSQAYSERYLLLQLLASIGKSVDEAMSESKLGQMLYQSLKGRKYLIVIDDIWSCKAWDDVGLCFPDDNNGSRVLLTTRLSELALRASHGGFTHNLGHLNEDQSWELLCRKTFRGYECPESLIETGKHIAKKCGGLPLALVVIAGLLEK